MNGHIQQHHRDSDDGRRAKTNSKSRKNREIHINKYTQLEERENMYSKQRRSSIMIPQNLAIF